MNDKVGWQPGDPLYPATPPRAPRDRRVDLEHLPAQWLSAHGNSEGAQWVYDAVAEIEVLRARNEAAQPVVRAARDLIEKYDDGWPGNSQNRVVRALRDALARVHRGGQ